MEAGAPAEMQQLKWQLAIVTGASKGFGASAAVQLATASRSPTHFRLVGRDAAGLAAARAAIEGLRGGRATVIEEVVADLAAVAGLGGVAQQLFAVPTERAYYKVFFLNNHGSLGPLANIGGYDGDTLTEMSVAFNLNVTSSCFLTSDLMQRCQPGGVYAQTGVRKVAIVNVSSLAAVQPFGSWGIYCAGKAAREMYHRCLTEEVGKREASALPVVRVLNYAPGPLDTDMQREIREGAAVDKATQDFYRSLKEEGKLVTPADSAAKLVRLLLFESYENGAHVDFYDVSAESIENTTCCACKSCACGKDCMCKEAKAPQCSACEA